METNQYQLRCEEWRLKALEIDYKERYQALKLSGYDEKMLSIKYFGVDYLLDREDARLYEADNQEKEIDSTTQFAIYHLFYYSQETPKNSGYFVPLHELKGAAPFAAAFKRQTLIPFAKHFEGKLDMLINTAEKMGFERLKNSDAGFKAMAFSCMPVKFYFWDGDDELPAEATILFDDKVTDFTHPETVIMIGDDLVKRIINASE
ncbi:DUF3786 domain-containing protein [Eubacteriaceae bacterium ES3]|nr:DUF3786 domain-containing protein [Eubacteriaceae bacterium ES3]